MSGNLSSQAWVAGSRDPPVVRIEIRVVSLLAKPAYTRLLTLLPMEGSVIVRDWFVVHSPAIKPLPQMAVAFERFLKLNGQGKIDQLLALREALPGMALKRKK